MIRLTEREEVEAYNIGYAALKASEGKARGVRLEVMALILANEIHAIAGLSKAGDGLDVQHIMDDMMCWISERAGMMIGEVAMSGVEKTTPQ